MIKKTRRHIATLSAIILITIIGGVLIAVSANRWLTILFTFPSLLMFIAGLLSGLKEVLREYRLMVDAEKAKEND